MCGGKCSVTCDSIFTRQCTLHLCRIIGMYYRTLFLSLPPYGILFLSVAVSTIERQCSREAAFFHAYV